MECREITREIFMAVGISCAIGRGGSVLIWSLDCILVRLKPEPVPIIFQLLFFFQLIIVDCW